MRSSMDSHITMIDKGIPFAEYSAMWLLYIGIASLDVFGKPWLASQVILALLLWFAEWLFDPYPCSTGVCGTSADFLIPGWVYQILRAIFHFLTINDLAAFQHYWATTADAPLPGYREVMNSVTDFASVVLLTNLLQFLPYINAVEEYGRLWYLVVLSAFFLLLWARLILAKNEHSQVSPQESLWPGYTTTENKGKRDSIWTWLIVNVLAILLGIAKHFVLAMLHFFVQARDLVFRVLLALRRTAALVVRKIWSWLCQIWYWVFSFVPYSTGIISFQYMYAPGLLDLNPRFRYERIDPLLASATHEGTDGADEGSI